MKARLAGWEPRLQQETMMSDLATTTGPELKARRCAGLARNWWALEIRGVIAVIFGILAFVWPGVTIASLVLVIGIYWVVDGVFGLVAAVRAVTKNERWGWLAFEGAISILAGLAALALPELTVLVWIYIIAAWAVITGVAEVVAAFRLDHGHGRWWLVLAGVVSVGFGALLWVYPVAGAVALMYWVGAYAVVFGASLIALGWVLRNRHKGRTAATGTAAA
jgi:uncharacterized membrane protein HdeD (DUF308 family)